MASAGFYYTGSDRVLKCFVCKSTVTYFRKGDYPIITGHRSGCPFVRVMKRTENTAAAAAVGHSLTPLGEVHRVVLLLLLLLLWLGTIVYNLWNFLRWVCMLQSKTDAGK